MAPTGSVETVYNWRIEKWHTYFVSSSANCSGIWAHNTAYEEHHSDPMFMGGDPDQLTTRMTARQHRDLHRTLNRFLRTQTDELGNHMRPQRGNTAQ